MQQWSIHISTYFQWQVIHFTRNGEHKTPVTADVHDENIPTNILG